MDLSLDISGSHIKTLTDALNEFTKTETLTGDNKVHCQKCGTKRTATKGLRLATAPSILVCHLKRFAYDEYGELVRLRKKVRFPLRLEIGDFMSRVNKARPPPYDLVAVLVHQGQSCDSGHYISYVKNNGEWFLCNDSVVEKVDISTVLDQQAYILMYEVAEMREKSGFHSPSSRSPGRSPSWRDDSSIPPARGFQYSSLLCGMDDTIFRDICCAKSAFCNDSVSYEARFTRRGPSHDDLSTLGESTVDSVDKPLPLNRSASHGSQPRVFENVIKKSGHVSTKNKKKNNKNSDAPHVFALVPAMPKKAGMPRGSSTGQMPVFDDAKIYPSETTSDGGVSGIDEAMVAMKWKPSKHISRPFCRESSSQLPRHESYPRSKPAGAVTAQQELDDLSP
jgi:hypothetical protein